MISDLILLIFIQVEKVVFILHFHGQFEMVTRIQVNWHSRYTIPVMHRIISICFAAAAAAVSQLQVYYMYVVLL